MACQPCGSNVYFNTPDIQQPQTSNIVFSPLRLHPHGSGSGPLPSFNPPSSSGQPSRLSQPANNPAQMQPTVMSNQSHISVGGLSSGMLSADHTEIGQFVYWCIDNGDSYAQSVELDTRQLIDHSFSIRLLIEYTLVKGWWHQLWTMTSCGGANFKKVRDSNLPN